MAKIAIIGGTGLTSLKNLEITERQIVQTPYGEPSGPLTRGVLNGQQVIFLPRHGYGHTIPPHKVNYRANLWTLREAGVMIGSLMVERPDLARFLAGEGYRVAILAENEAITDLPEKEGAAPPMGGGGMPGGMGGMM